MKNNTSELQRVHTMIPWEWTGGAEEGGGIFTGGGREGPLYFI